MVAIITLIFKGADDKAGFLREILHHLISYQHVDARGALFVDVAQLPEGHAEQGSNLLHQLQHGQLLQEQSMVHFSSSRFGGLLIVPLLLRYVDCETRLDTPALSCIKEPNPISRTTDLNEIISAQLQQVCT